VVLRAAGKGEEGELGQARFFGPFQNWVKLLKT
jgi:hypothetical protein